MTLHDQVTAQLATELGGIASALGALVGAHEFVEFERTLTGRVRSIAASLLSLDDREAAQAVIDVMVVLWPNAAPEDCGRADWWSTPLGRVCARSLGRDDIEAVTQSVAAAMLGVTRGTIAQMVHRGTLDRHPDGGVLRSSVMQRLSRTT